MDAKSFVAARISDRKSLHPRDLKAMNLSRLESDLLGELAQDDHSQYEIFEFVRLHDPASDDQRVFAEGRALVELWVERHWLALAGEGAMWGSARAVTDLVPLIDRVGQDVLRYFVGSPWVRLAPKAYADVEWLRPVG